jgi:transcriptional regulator with XRE-family HTH domain
MGRPAKNANHPLVRLRRQLSSPDDEVTRKDLAKRTGIPEPTLRDIERGKYRITPEVAIKVSFATKVDPRSLLAGDDPLLDILRQPFSKDTAVGWSEYPEWREEYRGAREQLFLALLDAAAEKKIVRLIYFSFENWLATTIETLGLNDLFAQKLIDRFTSFDPYFISGEFLPKNKRLAAEWSDLEYQMNLEYGRLVDQYEAENPGDPVFFSSKQVDDSVLSPHAPIGDLLKLEYELKKKLRLQARENLSRQRRETAEKTTIPKPVSGKRPRSAGRPAA